MTTTEEPLVRVRFLRGIFIPPSGPWFQAGDEAEVPQAFAELLYKHGRPGRRPIVRVLEQQ